MEKELQIIKHGKNKKTEASKRVREVLHHNTEHTTEKQSEKQEPNSKKVKIQKNSKQEETNSQPKPSDAEAVTN